MENKLHFFVGNWYIGGAEKMGSKPAYFGNFFSEGSALKDGIQFVLQYRLSIGHSRWSRTVPTSERSKPTVGDAGTGDPKLFESWVPATLVSPTGTISLIPVSLEQLIYQLKSPNQILTGIGAATLFSRSGSSLQASNASKEWCIGGASEPGLRQLTQSSFGNDSRSAAPHGNLGVGMKRSGRCHWSIGPKIFQILAALKTSSIKRTNENLLILHNQNCL